MAASPVSPQPRRRAQPRPVDIHPVNLAFRDGAPLGARIASFQLADWSTPLPAKDSIP